MKRNKIRAEYTGSIGIVGGVGPYAGLDLAKKIFDLTKSDGDKDHLPLIIISFPHLIEDRTEFILDSSTENPGFAISKIIKQLYEIGAEVVGIPCNTAHAKTIFEVIRANVPEGLILINMLDELALFITKYFPSFSKIGILSTTGTFRTDIYQRNLSKHNLTAVNVTEDIQEKYIHPAIYDKNYGIKSCSNPTSDKTRDNLQIGIDYLIRQGVEAIILGCTEISLAIREGKIKGVPFIDPTTILARSLILEFSPESLSDIHHR